LSLNVLNLGGRYGLLEHSTIEQRVSLLRTHYKYVESCHVESVRKLCGILGQNNAPNGQQFGQIIKKFLKKIGSVDNIKSHF